ncbi:hypothetical protein [Marinobacter sp. ELB17]|uniref:hypothetical protein n=1 Tax=Marinobacter sp. ELB17 TaxID=270374 RepID=UPI0000F381F5|nr:hypothetical protein [Marinobacter sp. ELB17]EAZ98143.1 hypothetical protein MELB17_09673 [Marinobacter sp. ELB17]
MIGPIIFLGSTAREALYRLRNEIQASQSRAELAVSIKKLVAITQVIKVGLGNFSLHQPFDKAWSVKLVQSSSIFILNDFLCSSQAQLKSESPGTLEFAEWRDRCIEFTTHLESLLVAVVTSVRHKTLREWISDVRAESAFANSVDPSLCSADREEFYDFNDATIAKELGSLLGQQYSLTELWLETALSYYRGQYPARKAEVVSLGLDLATLYTAQIKHASKALHNHSRSISALDESSDAMQNHELSEFIAAAFAQWISAGHFVFSSDRKRRYSAPNFWKAILEASGTQVLCTPHLPNESCTKTCFGVPLSPLSLAQVLTNQTAYAVPEKPLPDYRTITRYIVCQTLDGLVDLTTDPSLEVNALLVCPADKGWIVIMKNEDENWCVGFAGGTTVSGQCKPYNIIADTFIPDQPAQYLGILTNVTSSGALYDQLLDMADTVAV